MKNTSIRSRAVFGICALAITVILIVARLICNFHALDIFTGYYTVVGKLISLYLPLIFVAAAAVFCFVPKFGITQGPTLNTPPVKISAVLPAAGLALYAFKTIEFYMLYRALSTIQLVALIASVFGVVFFVLIALSNKLESAVYLICGIAVIFWSICAVATSYFDLLLPMNSPLKITNQLGLLSLMLLALSEIRAVFDTKRRQLQLFSVTTATILLGVASVPNVISNFMGKLPYAYDLIFVDVVLLGAFVFAAARLITLCFAKDAEPDTDLSK